MRTGRTGHPEGGTSPDAPPSPRLARDLERLAQRFPYDRSLPDDPLSLVQPFAAHPRSAEIVGVFAATMAVGNVQTILGSLRSLLDQVGPDPAAFIERFDPVGWRDRLHPWKHRWIRWDQMGFLALRLHEIYRRYPGGLESVFRAGMEEGGGSPEQAFAGGLDALSRALRWGSLDQSPTFYEPPAGYLNLFPSPLAPGRPTCKRLALFVRWMVRTAPPDLGLWRSIPPSVLHVPLDTHVYWIAKHVGLTDRKTRTWPTVTQITRALRVLDPNDPVRFDFALAHTGISGDCPKHRDAEVCGRCALRPDCDLWQGRGGLRRASRGRDRASPRTPASVRSSARRAGSR